MIVSQKEETGPSPEKMADVSTTMQGIQSSSEALLLQRSPCQTKSRADWLESCSGLHKDIGNLGMVINERFDQLDESLDELLDMDGDAQNQNEAQARATNSLLAANNFKAGLSHPDSALDNFMDIHTNEPIERFPATVGEFNSLNPTEVNQILASIGHLNEEPFPLAKRVLGFYLGLLHLPTPAIPAQLAHPIQGTPTGNDRSQLSSSPRLLLSGQNDIHIIGDWTGTIIQSS